MNTNTESVALCLPVYDKVHPKAWKAHVELSMHLGRTFHPANLAVFYAHKLPQPHAQNYLFQSVLLNEMQYGVAGTPLPGGNRRADWILWVEDDTTPPKDAFELLRGVADPVDRPVMHGLSFDRAYPYHPSIWRVAEDGLRLVPIADWQPNTVYKIAHSGTCCSLIHTTVFEKMTRPWFRMQPFENGIEDQGMIPCISLSRRMHEADIPIHGFTGCIAGHISDSIEVTADVSRDAQTKEGLL